ncbi:hypothetical protein RF11_13555 [Thelohanellus kitauei]|uniref:Uncharacterized protein n=1 Tax=Thelohanellus kitauei TaxID=669202 RepID=A0A0C2N4W8_THEKT|nr:hypothetical protein RF11_13555 [Thelohanellus kitauei]
MASLGVGVFAMILKTIGRDFCPQIAKFNGILVLSLFGFMIAFLNILGLFGVCRRSKSLSFFYKVVFSLLFLIFIVLTFILNYRPYNVCCWLFSSIRFLQGAPFLNSI